MNPSTQNTDTLRDIHLPDAISWWPPAIGWWLLLVIIITALVLVPKLYRYLTYTPLNRVAKQRFKNIIADYTNNKNELNFISAISQFLRQTAMSYYSREQVAQLTGEDWLASLNDLTNENHFNQEIKQTLINAPYQKNFDVNAEQIITAVQNWLNELPKNKYQKKGLNK